MIINQPFNDHPLFGLSDTQHQSNTVSLRPTSSLDALSRHRISEVTGPWAFRGLSSINSNDLIQLTFTCLSRSNLLDQVVSYCDSIFILFIIVNGSLASRSQISKSVPNASSDSDLTRYRTLLADRGSQRGDRKSPSLSVATTAVEAAKIKVK